MIDGLLITASIFLWVVLGVFLKKRYFSKFNKYLYSIIYGAIVFPLYDLPGGISYYALSCATDSGQTINNNVKADGYIDAGKFHYGCGHGSCGSKIAELRTENKELYIEGNVINGRETGLATKKGKYRFYLSKMENPDCDLYKEVYIEKRPKMLPKYLPKGFCLASKELTEFTAKYKYQRKQDFFYLGTISRDKSVIIDLDSNEIIAKAAKYRYFYSWFYRKLVSWKLMKDRHLTCSGVEFPLKRHFFSGIINEVFLPNINR